MNSVKFRIFVKSEKYVLTPNRIIHTSMLILLIPLVISIIFFDEEFPVLEKTMAWLLGITFFIGIGLIIINFSRRKPLNGKLIDYLEFHKDKIVISKREYSLDDLIKIDVNALDFYNKRDTFQYDYNPSLSNGVSNWFDLKLTSGETVRTYFQLFYENEIQKIKDFMIEYHHQGKVSFLTLINFLNITDYDEIQEFKKEMVQQEHINL